MNGGVGLVGLLGILFVALKLTGVIAWSWWLVLLPFYAGIALFAAFFVILFLIAAITDWK